MLGKIEVRRRKGQQRMRWLDGIINAMDMSLSKFLELVMEREAWLAAVHGVTKSRTQQNNSISVLSGGAFGDTARMSLPGPFTEFLL